MHPFEKVGLGKAPFKFVGMVSQDLRYGEAILNRAEYEKTGIAITTKPGGTCDYCGTYIVQMFKIAGADGKTFKVGCDCVAKVCGSGERVSRDVKQAAKAHASKVRKAREASKGALDLDWLEGNKNALSMLPHPNAWRASNGATLLDYLTWFIAHAGVTGKAKAFKIARAALGEK